mmetsp:Transcript_55650/g.131408  ORF Transcript_55650/g.131408 Transcript_55650/m.131408 type:complete len:199 (+) Transcript_55650:63-659(+)|eukprot:CAMPEP_0117015784 /NCGR_PEP_ID=MMETSP0472-20121206/12539_1 /TAXON_ID=693140 ORGANISM="Tiarina fusus, Strain LIS" /NCGR_SAMPLE_ID=MMETSP0472 /ASSEMBLY_ACC=CAM_ASM_000603 /LENGTH=198 /DNA_ID=CAMNT_0004719649 /DNA_START=56 /DNA_END=652 /DNA_ORIENTATION=-
MSRMSFKVVLLGEGRVGKTSLVLRYVNNVFSEKQTSTIQASFLSKRLTINDTTVNLAIWDTAGQERFHALGPIYYRDADGALLAYDITDAESFTKVKNWVKELRKMVGNEIVLVIAGNKSDLDKQRQVSVQEAETYAASVNAQHFSTSAKTSKGIDECFLSLTKKILEKKQTSRPKPSGGGLAIVDDAPKPAKKDGCC